MSIKLNDDGFTLVEALAALAIFSFAAVAVINLSAQNTQMARIIEQRAIAAIVADNQIVLDQLDENPIELGVEEGSEIIGEREVYWRKTTRLTPQSGVAEVFVEAGEKDNPDSDFMPVVERSLLRKLQ